MIRGYTGFHIRFRDLITIMENQVENEMGTARSKRYVRFRLLVVPRQRKVGKEKGNYMKLLFSV